ncbi:MULTISPECIES: citrulline utilization hydrolase CtlX [Rhizobium/Agrobacterium group]|uniref:citrulline utilization hydrolase CtlX n=2 Tax=Rhizobium/Agrobacterium group TaxID=227290 RepID=UPI001484F298|nr:MULTISPECIES: arginine deiminase-related protein [Rhizobium/Agrobacterium group]MCZ7455606.1 arginine deiminase-related protein [Rhizobium rhizogenes]
MMKKNYSIQAPAAVVMVRPHHFTVNTETAADNRFQATPDSGEDFSAIAHAEITRAAQTLESHGVTVHLFEDEGTQTPDSVFPNNWFSTHAGGHVAIYPMKAESRRRERRHDVIEMLKSRYRVQDIIDYSGLEPDGLFLEGTGAMVLDHIDRVAYAVRSDRTDPIALERFSTHFNFEPMVFDARDEAGVPVYHTNVLMCIGTDYAMIGLDMIADEGRRAEIVARLERSGRRVIALTNAQIRGFAGNALELQGRDGRILALSNTAYASLTAAQRDTIRESAVPVALDIPTVEKAGGSVRCTLAGIHLTPR